MMAFMRGHGDDNLESTKSVSSDDLQTQEDAQQRYLEVSNKKSRRGTILLSIFFGVGLLGLLFMIKQSAPKLASANNTDVEEAQLESAISRITGVSNEMYGRMDEIVNKFYEFSEIDQIEVDELIKDPFEYDLFSAGNDMIGLGDSNFDAKLLREQRLREETKNMQLLSIMRSGSKNCCMIDGEVLYKGDIIKGLRVTNIFDDRVSLEAKGLEITLKLSE